MCRRQPGIGMCVIFEYYSAGLNPYPAIGRLCEKCDGKWWVHRIISLIPRSFILISPVCDSYVRPETLVRICDDCNFGTYGGRCIICGAPGTFGSSGYHSKCVRDWSPLSRYLRCILLCRMHASREGSGRLPKDCEPRSKQNRPLLWKKTTWWAQSGSVTISTQQVCF